MSSTSLRMTQFSAVDKFISSVFEEGLKMLSGILAIISMRFEAPRVEKPSILNQYRLA